MPYMKGLCLTHRQYTKLKRLAKYKQSSLLVRLLLENKYSALNMNAIFNVIKLLLSVIYEFFNKLECLSMANFSSSA
jgi:hypothetical protein